MAMAWIIEQAKEELRILESQHPNRFDYLKLELETFISTESEKLWKTSSIQHFLSYSSFSPATASAATQASSSRKRKKSSNPQIQKHEAKFKLTKQNFGRPDLSKKRVDAVIKKAEACLQKIQELKTSLANIGDNLV